MPPILQHSLAEKLPRYTRALAQLTRALCVRQSSNPGGVRAVRSIAGLASRFARPVRLELDSALGPATIVLDGGHHTVLDTLCDEPDPDRSSALANFWLAGLLAHLDVEDVRPTVRSISNHTTVPEAEGLLLTLTANDTRVDAIVTHLPERLAQLYERVWAPAPDSIDFDMPLDLAVPATLRLRSRQCSPSVLASLQRHDVLLGWQPALPFPDDAGPVHATLRVGAPRGRQLSATVRLGTHAATLETPMNLTHAEQPSDLDAFGEPYDPSTDHLVPVGSMELPVHIEMACVNLSIGQLSTLQPGYVLDVPLPIADAAVRLVSYGQILAFGRLVAVGENLGVQIERMAGSDERQS